MSEVGEAVKLLAVERPELIPLVRVIFDLGDEGFNDGLEELTRRGILTFDMIRVGNGR